MSQNHKANEKALDIAVDLTKQLITLSTAVVTVVIAIVGLFKSVPTSILTSLTITAGLEFVSIIFGLLVHSAMIAELDGNTDLSVVYKKSVLVVAILQWVFFLAGLFWAFYSLVIYSPTSA